MNYGRSLHSGVPANHTYTEQKTNIRTGLWSPLLYQIQQGQSGDGKRNDIRGEKVKNIFLSVMKFEF